jgi:DNA-binding CsgD family transcriptional regulator
VREAFATWTHRSFFVDDDATTRYGLRGEAAIVSQTWRRGQELLERESELGSIAELVARTRSGSGGILLIRGAAGIGKTELLRAACGLARDSGVRVVTGRGTELERDLPFGLVRQLADRVLVNEGESGRAELLAGPAAGAVTRVVEAPASGATADDPALLVSHGLFWLIANLAARGALLLAVDDAHWCDPASVRFLAYLAPRLDTIPVLLAIAARDEHETLSALPRDPATTTIEPPALTARAVAVIVRARLSAGAHEQFCRACHEITGGNAFYLHQLVDELLAQRFTGAQAEAPRVLELGPATVAAAVLVRLSRLPAAARELARSVAVLGEQAEHRHVLGLAELDQSAAVEAIAALAGARLIEDARPLRFVHPIVRNAIYRDLTSSERAAAHRRAARLLMADAAPGELVAPQLVLADPSGDPAAVHALRDAAAGALARGAPDAAVAWLTRALAEPPPAGTRASVLFELGRAQALAHDPAALERLAAALDSSDEPHLRALAARLLARILLVTARWPDAFAVLDRAVDALGESDRELALALAGDRAFAARLTPAAHGRRRDDFDRLRRLVGDSIGHPDSPAERTAVTQIAVDRTSLCEPAANVVALARGALANGRLLAEETADSPTYMVAVSVLLYADHLDDAAELFGAAIEDARARGSVTGFVMGCCFRAHAEFRRGNVAGAEADARASLESDVKPLPQMLPMQISALLDALAERGELHAAEAELAARGMVGELTDDYHAAHMLESRARLRLAQSRPGEALVDALDAGRRQELMQMPNPAIVPWRSTAAFAAAATGDRNRAVELAETELELARAFGAPRAIGLALRASALVGARTRRLHCLEEAAEVLADSPARLDHARALVDLGAALRHEQRRVPARDPLRRGLDMALTAGSVALATRASEELAASGAKPRRQRITGVAALTPSESRIARMAAANMTNSQIAQALFVVPRTVEMHLTSVYRKLSINSRGELAAVLGDGPLREHADAVTMRSR